MPLELLAPLLLQQSPLALETLLHQFVVPLTLLPQLLGLLLDIALHLFTGASALFRWRCRLPGRTTAALFELLLLKVSLSLQPILTAPSRFAGTIRPGEVEA